MSNLIDINFITILEVVAKTIGVFGAVMIITKIFGLRTFAKMSSIDFASTIAIGSILASVILNANHNVTKGAIALLCIVGLQEGTAYLKKNTSWFDDIISNRPLLLMRDGEILEDNLSEAGVSVTDLMAKLRESNAYQLSNVKAVVMETTGDISVLHGQDDNSIDELILKDVER